MNDVVGVSVEEELCRIDARTAIESVYSGILLMHHRIAVSAQRIIAVSTQQMVRHPTANEMIIVSRTDQPFDVELIPVRLSSVV